MIWLGVNIEELLMEISNYVFKWLRLKQDEDELVECLCLLLCSRCKYTYSRGGPEKSADWFK